ncbi:MAG: CBS domain-containing protein [Gammaproteobacteria bacterium]|nr:CBS domain-containing protein [Gammaproteobacteria bacterium]
MSENDINDQSKSWLEKLSMAFINEPTSRDELVSLLRSAQQRELLDDEALSIIEGAMTVSKMKTREIMVPRSQVVFVQLDMTPEEFLPLIIDSGHSRFPVLDDGPDKVVGILMAKDLLPLALNKNRIRFNIRDILRNCTAIPESKPVDILLQDFREKRNHIAVVYDEYANISGIVTIEDVLEQIIGDIEDEYDIHEDDFIKQHTDGSYTVKALTPIEDFNEHFGCHFSDRYVDTVGGVVLGQFGHLPKRDETVVVDGFNFKVLNADSRRIHLLELVLTSET